MGTFKGGYTWGICEYMCAFRYQFHVLSCFSVNLIKLATTTTTTTRRGISSQQGPACTAAAATIASGDPFPLIQSVELGQNTYRQ